MLVSVIENSLLFCCRNTNTKSPCPTEKTLTLVDLSNSCSWNFTLVSAVFSGLMTVDFVPHLLQCYCIKMGWGPLCKRGTIAATNSDLHKADVNLCMLCSFCNWKREAWFVPKALSITSHLILPLFRCVAGIKSTLCADSEHNLADNFLLFFVT